MSSNRTPTTHVKPAIAAALLAAVAAASPAGARTDVPASAAGAAPQTTFLISKALDGSVPNGESSRAVISNDKRYSRVIAFESDASDLVRGDDDGQKDVFAVLRKAPIGNKGAPWRAGRTILVSRTKSGQPANGPSFNASVDGSFHTRPSCVGFLSDASNMTPGDTNGTTDAFVAKLGKKPKRVSRGNAKTTQVAVSGNCKLVAFVSGGKLYVAKPGGRPHKIKTRGKAADPSFSTGLRNDLVFGARGGVYLAKNGRGRAKLVGRGGRNPAYNDIKRRTVTYEKRRGGHMQIAYHDLGKRERIVSRRGGSLGNGDSTLPVIGNSGYYVTFQTLASNLGVNATGRTGDGNGNTDVYLYTDTRKITLIQSSGEEKGEPLPAGGENGSMSFYANYITFDTPSQLSSGRGSRQVFMRYVGGL